MNIQLWFINGVSPVTESAMTFEQMFPVRINPVNYLQLPVGITQKEVFINPL